MVVRVFLVAHGFVQGVGYRHLVKRAAERSGISGMVRNVEDGSVEILADGSASDVREFEKEINVSMKNGPTVLQIERYPEGHERFPKDAKRYEGFVVER